MSKHRSAVLEYEGNNRFVAATGTKRTIVYGDEIPKGELSPMETVMVSLASCSAMDVISIALKKRQDLATYRVHVEAIQRDEYPQVFTRVDLTHEVSGPGVQEAAIRRCIELSALKYCPVNAMLSAGATEVHHRFVVRDTSDAAGPRETSGEVVVTGPYKRPDIVP
jgi:uncharacterized OsmC-like protein